MRVIIVLCNLIVLQSYWNQCVSNNSFLASTPPWGHTDRSHYGTWRFRQQASVPWLHPLTLVSRSSRPWYHWPHLHLQFPFLLVSSCPVVWDTHTHFVLLHLWYCYILFSWCWLGLVIGLVSLSTLSRSFFCTPTVYSYWRYSLVPLTYIVVIKWTLIKLSYFIFEFPDPCSLIFFM